MGEWVIDHAHDGLILYGEGERYGDIGECVDEIGSSINGIDDESWCGSEFGGRGRGFFTQEANGLSS